MQLLWITNLKQFFQKALLCLLFTLLAPVLAHAKPTLNDVRLGVHPDKTRVVIDLSEEAGYRIFTLKDPYRVVIDFPDLDWKAKETAQEKGMIKSYRHGLFSENVMRIVLEVDRPVLLEKAFYLKGETSPHAKRFVLDVKSTTEAEFSKRRGESLKHEVKGAANALQILKSATPQIAAAPKEPSIKTSPRVTNKKKIIVLDPGHGGVDPGAIGVNRVYEKTITLAIAKQLKTQLMRSGKYDVRLTREKDIFIPLRQRVAIARRANADLFVSIHADSVAKRQTRGVSVYTLSENGSDREANLLAARENKADVIAGMDLSTEDDEVAGILIELAQRETMNSSKQLANLLVQEIGKGTQLLTRPNRSAGFAVLKAPDIPSVLIETGYLSNPSDSKLLRTASHQQKLSRLIGNAVEKYFQANSGHHQAALVSGQESAF